MNLRAYQREALEAVHEKWDASDSTLAVMPTGTGKTIVFGHLIRERLNLGRAMVLAHRKELIWQAAEKVEAVTGVRCGVEMADNCAPRGSPIVIATVQTLASNGRIERFSPDQFATLIADEAHHYVAPMFRAPIEYFQQNPALKVLGVTATPDRKDEEALGQVFHTVAYDYSIWDAIMDGWLVRLKHWAKQLVGLDLSGVKMTDGELNGRQLAEEIAKNENLEAIAAATVECAGDRRTLVFADSVENAAQLVSILDGHRRGQVRLLVDKTPRQERECVVRDYRAGAFQFLVNVGICTEGFDIPEISCVALARPTGSRALMAQMCGRGTRPAPGIADELGMMPNDVARRAAIAASNKPDCLIIDFVDATYRHDLVHPANILGGRISDRTVQQVNESARRGLPQDLLDATREAEAQIVRNDELTARCRGRADVRSRTKTAVDPFAAYGLIRRERRGWESDEPLDERQREKLTKWNIKGFESLTFSEAEQIVEEVRSRARRGLLTLNQEKLLRRYGYACDGMSYEAARSLIDSLAANGWRRR